jgi:hypothetical protein
LFSFVLSASDDTFITPVLEEGEAKDGKCRCARKGVDGLSKNEVGRIGGSELLQQVSGIAVLQPLRELAILMAGRAVKSYSSLREGIVTACVRSPNRLDGKVIAREVAIHRSPA